MRSWTTTSLVMLLFGVPLQLFGQPAAEQKADPNLPAPGTRGNADNVQYIGRSDPKGNAVRLAKATGHVSNYDESKVGDYKLPNPLVMNGTTGRTRSTSSTSSRRRTGTTNCSSSSTTP